MFLFLLHRKTRGHWANVIKHRWGNSQRCLNLVRKNSSSDVYPISNETPKRKSTQFCVIQFLIRCALFLFFYLASICMYVLWICCCASFTFSCIIWARVSVCIIICEIKDDVIFARILLSDRFFSACYFIAWFSSRLVVHLMKFVCLFFAWCCLRSYHILLFDGLSQWNQSDQAFFFRSQSI